MKQCKDCRAEGITTSRPAPHPGPRCATHHRQKRAAAKAASHDARVAKTYGIGRGDYERLYQAQGGRCAICGWATGASKRLAVDHDHGTGEVRGLLCGVCNQFVGFVRNRPEAFERGAAYLRNPPARGVLLEVEVIT